MCRSAAFVRTLGILALLSVAGTPLARAAQEAAPEQTLTVEVVDPAAYLKEGRHGPDQADQTYESVDGGQTLALLDPATSALYLLLADNPGDDPNALVYDYVNQNVKVTGRVYARNGVSGLVVTSVEPIEPAEPAEPAAASADNP